MTGDSKRVAIVRVGFPWWLRPFLLRDVVALTLGRRIWISERVRDVDALLRHEMVHVRQMAEHGVVPFLWTYACDYLRNRRRGMTHDEAYLAIPYEVEAIAAERADTL